MLFGYVVCCLLGLLCIVGLSRVFRFDCCLLGSLGVFGSCCLFVVLLFGWVCVVFLRYLLMGWLIVLSYSQGVALLGFGCLDCVWVAGACVIVCCLLLVLMLLI